jgi:hypothetical protein
MVPLFHPNGGPVEVALNWVDFPIEVAADA